MTFRPIDTAMTPGADAGASALSGNNLSSGLSAEFNSMDLSSASQAFQAGTGDGGALAAKALSGLDISGISTAATTPLAGTEAAAFMPATPGSEVGLLAAANDPMNPLIQLIMRLPGAMGIVNSFFEFLANFFLNPSTFLDFLNPMVLAQNASAAFSSLTSHAPAFSLSILPSNAPILNGMAQPLFSSDLLSAKLNLSLGNSSASAYSALAKPTIDLPGAHSLNVGGELTPQTAVFETGGVSGISVPQGHLSGPSLTDVGTSNHVAGNTRLFSDRMSGGSSFNSMNLAAKTPSPYGGNSTPSTGINSNSIQGLNHGSAHGPAAAGSFHQPGTNFVSNARFEGAPHGAMKESFAPHAGQNVGYDLASNGGGHDVGFNGAGAADGSGVSYGPSGSVGKELGAAGGGNNNMIAMDQPVQSFRPTLSGADSQLRSAFPTGQPATPSAGGGGGEIGAATGLKAKQLSLDSIAGSASKPASNVASSAGHGATAKLSGTPKVAESAISKADAPISKAADVSHKAADSAVHKVAHKADAPVHKTAHAVHKPHHVEAPKQVAQAPKQELANQQQVDANGNPVADGNLAADGSTVTDGTQIATNDAAASHYTVQKGDSLWNIAKNSLGDGTKWQEIYQLNQNSIGQNPDLIYPGTDIQLPGASPEIANGGTTTMTNYTVKPGDNLWDISEEVLGKGSRWGELYQANQDLIGANPRLIQPGQNLSIPSADPASAGVASAPDPNAMGGVDPSAGAQGAQPAAPQEISSGVDAVKSTASDYATAPNPYAPNPYAPTEATTQGMSQTPAAPAAAPEQLSYYESTMNAAQAPAATPSFQPTVAQASRGLPVVPANNVPIEAGPGAAMAASPAPIDATAASAAIASSKGAAATAAQATAATKGSVVATGAFAHLKDLFGKTK